MRLRTGTSGYNYDTWKGGFYPDGRFPTYAAVVDHYDRHRRLGLTPDEKRDLVESLKSL